MRDRDVQVYYSDAHFGYRVESCHSVNLSKLRVAAHDQGLTLSPGELCKLRDVLLGVLPLTLEELGRMADERIKSFV